jgi:iron(III) transport system permease protein
MLSLQNRFLPIAPRRFQMEISESRLIQSPARPIQRTGAPWLPHLGFRWLGAVPSLILTLVVLVPIGVLLTAMLTPDGELWARMWRTFLPDVLWNTLRLAVGVGVGTITIGTLAAWAVSAYEFPGRAWFDRLLLLPLAIPGFIMGFVYVALFEFAGPVQTTLRNTFGWSRGDYWFPNIASPAGLILVLTLVLYPYVYILARAAFQEQAASTLEASQVMGYGHWRTFRRVVLPLARPQIAAGALLAIMESMTDYGTVSYFSYPTLSERIVVLWNTSFDVGAAVQLASLTVLVALLLIFTERTLRGRSRFYQQGGRGRRPKRHTLRGPAKWSITAAMTVLLGMAFILPVTQLITWSIFELRDPTVSLFSESFITYSRNSLLLATSAAIVVMIVGLMIAYGTRTATAGHAQRPRWLARLVTVGYAMPGAVIAAGVLTVVNPIDGAVTNFAADFLGFASPGYLLTGTIIALTYAYTVRFMAVGFNSVDASIEKVKPSMEEAARMMGAKSERVLRRVHLPMVRTGMIAGAILVFVDVMKELPATLLLRPFGMDTLALRTYFLSVEGWHESAAIPALAILMAGLIPVFILMRVGDRHVD